jgi:hypothetical protein
VEKGGDFRLFNRFKVFFAFENGKIVGAPSFLQKTAAVGKTPEPCTGLGLALPLFSSPEAHRLFNGVKGITPSGTAIFQLNEGRIGFVGQAADRTINDCQSLFCITVPIGPTTPWIWSVIKFDVQGKLVSVDHQIFPTYSIYEDGNFVDHHGQSDPEAFISLDDTNSLKRPGDIQ